MRALRDEDGSPASALDRQAARALEASGLAFWDCDLEPGTVYLNAAWAEMLGEPRAPTLTTIAALYQMVPEEERPRLNAAFVAALKGESKEYRVDHRVRAPSGITVWVSSWGRVVERDANGRALRMMGINKDITARKHAEQARGESEERFMALFRSSPAPMALLDLETQRILDVNDAHVEQLGRPREQVIGKTSRELDLYANPNDREKIWEQLTSKGHARMDAVPFVDASGALRWHMVSARIVPVSERKTVVVTAVDITGRIDAEQALAASETRFRSAFKYSATGMALLSPEGQWLRVNDALCEIVGYGEEELLQTDYRRITYPEDRAGDLEFLQARVARGARGALQRERRFVRKDGTTVWVQINLAAVVDPDGKSYQIVAQIQDIAERKAAEAMAEHLALHDPLTALPNKRLLSDRLAIALSAAKRMKTYVGAIFIDLDGFKPVNDTWGHTAGDAVLRQIAQRLQSALRQSDTVARVGGDEFVVLATGVEQRSEFDRLVERLLAAIERPCEIEAGTATVSASIGMAIYPDDATNGAELIRRADAAMYEVKRARHAR